MNVKRHSLGWITVLPRVQSYHHVCAHQDDHEQYVKLVCPSQLNCIADLHTKRVIWGLEGEELPPQEVFSLDPIAVFVRQEKLTSDMGSSVRFWAHHILAEQTMYQLNILSTDAFQEVAWEQVYEALHNVPCLFQLWACKQVMKVAGTNTMHAWYNEDHDPR